MKTQKILTISVIGILLIGLVIGSFFDLDIAQAVYAGTDNGLGIFISAFGLIISCSIIPFICGGLFAIIGRVNSLNKFLRICGYTACILGWAFAIYFAGTKMFCVNGLQPATFVMENIVGPAIYLIPFSAIFYYGYVKGKTVENPGKIMNFSVLLLMAIVIVLLGEVIGIKAIHHRPRPRYVLDTNPDSFCNWWESCKNYKDLLTDTVTKEEFASLPSGHAASSIFAIYSSVIIPIYFPHTKKYEVLMYVLSFLYFAFVAFTRMLIGGHFLSDVCFGGLISAVCYFIAIWLADKYNLVENKYVKEQEKETIK